MPFVPAGAAPIRESAESIALSGATTQHFLLYLPQGYEADSAAWPLLVFLHGAGERGTSLDVLAKNGLPAWLEQGRELPGIVVSPLLTQGFWDPAAINTFIQQLQTRYRIDPERIYVTGLSLGGNGAWRYGEAYPNTIAALAPICGWGTPGSAMRNLPVWAYHGALDTTVALAGSQSMISALRAAGGFPRFTVYPFINHDAWSPTFASDAYFDWLFAQTRSPATTTVLAPTGFPKPLSLSPGQTANFQAQTAATGASFHWQRLPSLSALWSDLHEGGAYTGTTTATLAVGPLNPAMDGDRFRCVVTDASGSTTTPSAVLTVRIPAGSTYLLQAPTGIALDAAGNLLVADRGRHTVNRITPTGGFTTLAGSADTNGYLDSPGTAALFDQPFGLVATGGDDLFVTDSANAVIRKINAANIPSTYAGAADSTGSTDGAVSTARFAVPTGLALDPAGTLFVTDAYCDTIRKLSSTGTVSTLAGSPAASGASDGFGPAARFNYPNGVVVDGTAVLIADTDNHTIRRIASDGTTSTFAGAAGQAGSADGSATTARFNHPHGLARDAAGNLYVADTGNHTIRRLSATGTVSTLAGSAGVAGLANGSGTAARFNLPFGLVADAGGNLYVADTGNSAIRYVTTTGNVSTLTLTAAATTPTPPTPPTTPTTPTPPTTPTSSGGGGGGSLPLWFAAALAAGLSMRRHR